MLIKESVHVADSNSDEDMPSKPLSAEQDISTEQGQRACYNNFVTKHEGTLQDIHRFLVCSFASGASSRVHMQATLL